MIEQNRDRSRNKYVDALRALCIFLVLYNHTQDKGFELYAYEHESAVFFLYLMYSVFCKVAVPCFFAILGMYLMKKEEPIRASVIRVTRFVGILIAFSFFMQLYNIKWDMQQFDFYSFLLVLYSKQHATAYWYLYSYISFLLALPVFHLIAKNINKIHIQYLMGLYLANSLLRILQWFVFSDDCWMNSYLESPLLISTFIFPFCGYYLENRLDIDTINIQKVFFYNTVAFVSIVISAWLTVLKCDSKNLWEDGGTQAFFSVLILFPLVAIILNFKLIYNRGMKFNILGYVGRASFCTFLLEKPCRDLAFPIYECTKPYLGSFLASNFWAMGGVLIGTMVFTIWRLGKKLFATYL